MDDASNPKLIRDGTIGVLSKGREGSFLNRLNSLDRNKQRAAQKQEQVRRFIFLAGLCVLPSVLCSVAIPWCWDCSPIAGSQPGATAGIAPGCLGQL